MSAPRRVLLTADAVGGVWQYSADLARALGERGVETVVALLGPSPDAGQRAEFGGIAGARLVETGEPLDWLCDGPGPVLAAGRRIAELARDMGADLVHLNSPALGAAFHAPFVAVTHGCVSTWWEAARPGEPVDPALAWHRELTGQGLRAAVQVASPTGAYGRAVARLFGLTRMPEVVHNGRALSAAQAVLPQEDRALTVGRLWDPVKGAALLDRVAARLAVPFDAAGPVRGPHGETAALRHLRLLGRLDAPAVADRLARRPVFVSAARFEPFGLAVLEAAGAGCALVLADIPAFRELWDGAALFVPAEEEAGYLSAIDALIGDGEARQRLGEAARQRAARYTPAAMAEGMLRLYAQAAGAQRVAA